MCVSVHVLVCCLHLSIRFPINILADMLLTSPHKRCSTSTSPYNTQFSVSSLSHLLHNICIQSVHAYSAHLQPVLLLYELEHSIDHGLYAPRKRRSLRVQEQGLGPGSGSGQGSGLGLGAGQGVDIGMGSGSGGEGRGRGSGGLRMDHSGGNSSNPCTTHSSNHSNHDPDGHNHNPDPNDHNDHNGHSDGHNDGDTSPHSQNGNTEQKENMAAGSSHADSTTTNATTPTTITNNNNNNNTTTPTMSSPLEPRRPVSGLGSGLITSALSLLPWG